METVQTEYMMAYGLTAACLFLGLLMVCVPRPRRSELPEEEDRRKKANKKARQKKRVPKSKK